ncbi:NmrA family NAD(P)-binding protein [Paenibacillus sp. S-38]|uniref:NmrA family NAD(P)-binding protein n=1 Tax=Paenibacillus sp. S-38 TaxID=3416710 RepID=UPI003CF8939E
MNRKPNLPTAGEQGPILVIGATGAQGGAAARSLLEQGHRVRILVRDPLKARHMAELGAEICSGDLSVPASLEAAGAGIRSIRHPGTGP